jgi:hypothetical protein
MGKNPINLALRFALELTSLFALGYWGFTQFDGVLRWLIGLGAPLVAATLWGTFRVDYEPKKAPVRVPGIVRLGIEILVLGGGVLAFYLAGRPTWALINGALLVFHYAISYDRLAWLIRQ